MSRAVFSSRQVLPFLMFFASWCHAAQIRDNDLVDIKTIVPSMVVELRYATKNNFTKEVVYTFNKCFVIRKVAEQLRGVQEELRTLGLGLKIWDGFRPKAAAHKFWELCPDERYVANPNKRGSAHTRGTTVDVTLVTKEGQELSMPSSFDDFSEKAHLNYKGATHEEIANRELLRSIMEKHGFATITTEWWHFNLKEWLDYPPLDVDASLLN